MIVLPFVVVGCVLVVGRVVVVGAVVVPVGGGIVIVEGVVSVSVVGMTTVGTVLVGPRLETPGAAFSSSSVAARATIPSAASATRRSAPCVFLRWFGD